MNAKLFALLSAFVALAAACGSATVDQATTSAGENAPTDEAQFDADDDAAMADDDGSSDGDSSDDEASGTDGADGDDGAAGDHSDGAAGEVEPGSADDRSLVEDSSGPVGALLFADTIEGPQAPSSAAFEGRMLIVGAPGSEFAGSYEINVSGAFDIANDASDLTIDMGGLIGAAAEAEGEQLPAGMQELLAEPMQIIVIEEMGWLKWPLLSLLTGSSEGGDLWIELEADEVSDTTESFGFASSAGDPTAMLEGLAAAEASVEDLGVETVNGVEARHWRALLDLEALAAESDAEERAELEAQFGDLTANEFPLDVWIGVADGYVYRYVLDLSSEAVLADAEPEFESVSLTFDFFGYNADQGISPPPADRITSGDELFSSGFADSFGG